MPREKASALRNPPLRRHVITRGGKRTRGRLDVQTGWRWFGKGRDNETEEDCACAWRLSLPAACRPRRLGLWGKESGRKQTEELLGFVELLGAVVGFSKTLPNWIKKDGNKSSTVERLQLSFVKFMASLLPEAWAAASWVWD